MNLVKIFVEHMWHVEQGHSFKPRPNSHALATVGSVMTIGLSINGCLHSKIPV